ncbi:MAG: HDIG domain-containing protein [Phycisphaerales bacterium]|jgi:putative nucleotidyltransferase with HDIG domain|nr:HDIG domain-containing protein [Phycisphaerales bacterium]
MAANDVDPPGKPYAAVPLSGLAEDMACDFPLYLKTGVDAFVLYRKAGETMDAGHVGRLRVEGVGELFIRTDDLPAYFRRVETALQDLLIDRSTPLARRVEVLHGVARQVAAELFATPALDGGVGRAQRVVTATGTLMLREQEAFARLRQTFDGASDLAAHALRTSFLCMALARAVLGGDAATLREAGLAGLLHDVGRIGAGGDDDPDHALRGAQMLAALRLAPAIVAAVRDHHGPIDGCTLAGSRSGPGVSELARIVGIADAFDDTFAAAGPNASLFEVMRRLAEISGGRFAVAHVRALLRLFRV